MKIFLPGVALFALFATVVAHPQTQVSPSSSLQEQGTQPPGAAADEVGEQRRYDPLAGKVHLRGGIWDSALGKINPDNSNVGDSVSKWRQVVVVETIHNSVFWIAITLSCALLWTLLFLYWLLHDREGRVHITVNILTQIANAYLDARDHALDAIDKHNRLADDYNGLAERMAAIEQKRADNQKRVRAEARAATAMDSASDDSLPDASDAKQTANPELDRQTVAQLRRDAEAQSGQRLAHQISALNEKNKTLRASLNEVLAENERLKRANAGMTGV